MNKFLFLSLLILFSLSLCANITVKYDNGARSEDIIITKFDDIEYFRITELYKTFHAQIYDDRIEQKLFLNLYQQEIIFLCETPYFKHNGIIYSVKYPLRFKDGYYYASTIFLKKILPKIFPDKIKMKRNTIYALEPIDSSLKRIVLDAGHGGKDPGAISYTKKNYEKTITLSVVKKLKKIIEDNLDVEVLLTRDKDEFVSLQQRTKFADNKKADLFVSIHCNANNSSAANGVEVYYLSTAKTNDARAVESFENSVVYEYEGGKEAVNKYNDLYLILADMAQNEHLRESNELAADVVSKISGITNEKNRGVKQANFYVLRGAYMPAILIELGFLTNKKEEKKLINSTYQDKLAQAIFESLTNFKQKFDNLK